MYIYIYTDQQNYMSMKVQRSLVLTPCALATFGIKLGTTLSCTSTDFYNLLC